MVMNVSGMIVSNVSTRPDDWKDVRWGGFERGLFDSMRNDFLHIFAD
jgi:hypothetical protein